MGRVVGKLKIMTEMTRLKPDDFKRIVQIFLKEVRGSETQESLSEKLETSFNIFSRWENGARGFYWNDFVLLASLSNFTRSWMRFSSGFSRLSSVQIRSRRNLPVNSGTTLVS